MARAENTDVVDSFEAFYREYCRDDLGDLAQKYPTERKSLFVDYQDLYRFDRDLAADVRDRPAQMREYAEEALRLYDLPIDVSLGQAHVRFENLPETTEIREIRADHRGRLLAVQGIVRKATDVRPKITIAAFECQRCGTLTRIPQGDGSFQEPHECQGCERQGPFEINFDNSEFVDAQKLRVQESPEGLRGGETPQAIDVHIEDDITGAVTAGDNVRVSGILKLEQQGSDREKSPLFDVYMDGLTVAIEDEQFEEMDITAEDKERIVELAGDANIYDRVVDSIAPSIYGYDKQKLAIALQLFSGVTKNLPDGSRIRGDLHLLLIGDPGTGKCVAPETEIRLADGTRVEIGAFVESRLDDPKPVDDGVYDEIDVPVPTLAPDGSIERGRASRVWKREAPESLYRVRTASGRTVEVTPSHPLFVVRDGVRPVRADRLEVGALLAAAPVGVERPRSGAPVATDGGPIAVDRIVGIETVAPEGEWVYDLEVEGTHSYVSNGIFSHNSQLLQYIRNIAPRSVYTSGKGASSAGLCVTGDTRIHTSDGFQPIDSIVERDLPDPVDRETSVPRAIEVQTFDRADGSMQTAASSHVWRMPEKPCRRIETTGGRELEASVNTPVLTCGADGLTWKAISEIDPGDYVALPDYEDLDREAVPVREYLDLRTEKLLLTDDTVEWFRERLTEEFGTLRDAAAALDLSEDFIYLHLKNRHVPLEKLDRMLDAIGATRADVDFDRLMCRHGDGITIPETFDADLMYLLGLVFGDGNIALDRRDGNRGLVRISNGDEQVLRRAQEIFADKFDYRPEIERQDDRVPSIRVHSATIARLFANAGMSTPKTDLRLDPRLTVGKDAAAFVRGLMDADGSVSARDDGGSSVLLSTISEALAEQVQFVLDTYGVRASVRERDRRGPSELADGRTIESRHIQYYVEIYGADIDRYAATVGFEIPEKQAALDTIVGDCRRRDDRVPVGAALATAGGSSREFYHNLNRGDHPGRDRARSILEEVDLGGAEPLVREAVEADLRWEEVVAAVDTGEKELYDLTVPETHNFVGNGIVTHNTAAAVRDDFGDGQQWTLEAGALVLADQGIAAIDELDKMKCVTGDTLVHLGNRVARIRDVAHEAARDGTIELLDNGRTIRECDLDVWTMTADGRIERRPVTAIHEYDAPETLIRVTLRSGATLTTTPDHPFILRGNSDRIEREAAALQCGDRVVVPVSSKMATDGGCVEHGSATADMAGDLNVSCSPVAHVETVDRNVTEADHVYDLTVEGTHNYVANGMVVHNSEDRSAMHEALEQQSYHPETEVLCADGRRVEIGSFVDERMAEQPEDVTDGVDCDILQTDDIAVHTVDTDQNDVTKTSVDRVSRHEAPDEFVRVTFSNGRDVLVTPEHPMFASQNGSLETVEAQHLESGAFVPAPRKLPNSSARVELEDEPVQGKEHDVDLPDELTPDFGEILGLLIAEGHSYAGSAHEIGFSNQDERLLARADDLFHRVFGISSTDTTNAAGTVTKRWISTKLYRWFESNFPEFMHTARDKRIPSAVLGASEEVIRRFLVGAFAGDGSVESEAMAFSTASDGLAEDYADALAKIGVASRLHHDDTEDSWKTYVMGDSTARFVEKVVRPDDDRYETARSFVERSEQRPRHHDVLPPTAAEELRALRRLLGLRLTGQYRPNLDEQYGVQIQTVRAELRELRDRAVEIRSALDDAEDCAAIRSAIGWSGSQLADRIDDETQHALYYAEDGGYDDERREELRSKARTAVESAVAEFEQRADQLDRRCDLRYYRVTDVETVPNAGEHACEWVYDVTVEPTNTFVSAGVVLHNSISISKAGINATLKSRCSLLGAANPKYGRFDQYEPIGEQIDLEPALVSRFDLIFTVTDQPDPEEDAELAEHILTTNFAGELETHRTNAATPNHGEEAVAAVTEDVEPSIDPDLLRKYVAYAKRSCFPTMTETAREHLRDYYVDLRTSGADDDAPVPVTARKLEALVRLAEASARVRLGDQVTVEDARRATDIAGYCLEDIGMDPETGKLDADVIETGTSKSQRDRIKNIKAIIADIEDEYDEGAPVDVVIERAEEAGTEPSKAEHEIEKLKQKGEVYEPRNDHLRTT